MALKKPSDLFNRKEFSGVFTSQEVSTEITETYDRFRDNLDKVNVLSEKIEQLSQQLSEKLNKTDLENAMLSQLMVLDENFKSIQNQVKGLNKEDLKEFREKVTSLTEIVGELIEEELPRYKKQINNNEIRIGEKFDSFKGSVDENISDIRNDVDGKINSIAEVVDNNLEYLNNQLQETSFEVKKTTDTYNKLSKIVESKVSRENEKLEEYSKTIQSLYEAFVELESSLKEETSIHQQLIKEIVEEKFENISAEVKNQIDEIDEEVDNIKNKVSSEISNIKSDVVINEQHLKKVEKFLKENHQELIDLKEDVYGELEKLPYGDIQENVERLNKKIQYIEEVYKNIEPEVIVKEVIQEGLLNEPPSTKNEDPLTPLDQNFVTLNQLQEHYRLFLNRIQQQLATLGGGGETRLKYLDDIVGIATNASEYDGKYLKYNHSIQKFEFTNVDISNDSWVDGINGPYTNGNVGIGTSVATEALDVNGNIKLTGAIYGPSTFIIDPAVVGDDTGAVRIKGDLYVDGTQTVINSTTLEIADYQIGIATTAGTNLILDGAGIGIGSANISKTITWNNSSSALTSSEDWNLVSGKQYEINGTQVLSSTTLGTGVTNSSLTSVGTLRQLNVSGVATVGSNLTVNSGTLYVDATNNRVGINTLTPIQPFQVGAAGTNTVVVTDIGSVGIGTTNPTTKLHVVGDLNLDDGGTFTTTLQTVTPTANRTISLPNATGTVALVAGSSGQVTYNLSGINTGDANFTYSSTGGLVLGTNLTVSGVSTFQSSNLKIRNPANTFEYSIVGSAIAANRNLTLPLVTADDTVAVVGLSQTFTGSNSFSGTLTVPSGGTLACSGTINLTGGAVGGTHVFGTNQTSSTLTFGGSAGTGTITLGRSTATQQTDIQAGASGVGTTKTINLGTGGLSGSFTNINIGPTAGVGTVVINSGTNVGIGSTIPTQALDIVGTALASTGFIVGTSGATGFQIRLGTNDQTAVPTVLVGNNGAMAWSNTASADRTQNPDVRLFRDGSAILALRNSTTAAQTFRIYNTATNTTTNFERATLGWSNNDFIVGTEKGSSIGTARNLYLQTDGTTRVAINTTGLVGIGSTRPTQALDVRGNVVVSGFSSITDTRLNSISEETTIGVGNTVSLVYNTGGGNIGIITSPSGPITLNVTGIPTDSSFDNRSITFSVMVNQGVSVAYACSSITLNGVTPTIRWPGAVVAVGATNSYDIFNFTCINPTGSASTATNYVVLGVLNGNFR